MKVENNIPNNLLIRENKRNDMKELKNVESVEKKEKTFLSDEFIKEEQVERTVTYSKPDFITIEALKEESEKIYSNLKRIVKELLERQGYSLDIIQEEKEINIKVDDITREEALELISEGGALSPEKVSDRIVEFAIAISGGDKTKAEILKEAIIDGFKEAESLFGGTLPDISYKTYDLIMEKFDLWAKEE